ncbi:DEAD/DEAH box helicase [Cohnella xylanilytica]|uniref:DEAD/DEAH box helicase n=1 Tax=Cohnella xylanilytica TaxID=557555 RepID=UPI001B2A93C8|nr:DEAD/DEAH box helicase [Cohnella xylanilytica]GIO16410.1 DEAD/DEAH box helicase [Cohnella xylanilytica]
MIPTSLRSFHPVIAEWFSASFGEPTDVQNRAWEAIFAGSHTLIAAPTGSGKTLAALLPCLDRIVRSPASGPGVRVLYVTPLKALNNDIHHHAARFVEELDALAAAGGGARDRDWPGIRCAVRTGDTSQSARNAMLRRPPDVLVTTPESLFLLLASDKGRAMLRAVEMAIVDEIHDLAGGKRGAHLALSLERLAELAAKPVQRIGVSATQKPLERVARFLGGWEEAGSTREANANASEAPMAAARGEAEPADAKQANTKQANTRQVEAMSGGGEAAAHPLGFRPRPVRIVESSMTKKLSVTVTMPDQSRPVQTREGVWLPLLDRIVQLMEGARSVLIFVNSRRLCERLCLRLNDHVGYELARSHHGSVSRERRLEVERLLKEGSLRCIVATSSLELGIDVGHVDLVIQIESPLSAAGGIQRIGRAGHAVGEASRGVILARTKGPLPEIAVLSRQIAARDIEEIRIPSEPMDVLSQQIVGIVASADRTVDELHRLVVRCDNYHGLSRERLEEIVQVLAGLYPFVRPFLDWDRDGDRLTKRANSSMAVVTGAGTIPQTGNYPVHHVDSRVHLGELDEEFIQESRVGDVFQLGTSSWMIREIKQDRVYVSEAGNRFSEIPFWRNESGGRSYVLGVRVGGFMAELEKRLRLDDTGDEEDREALEDTLAWLEAVHGMDRESGGQLASLARSQHRFCGLPSDRRMLIETYKDVMNQTHVILHNYAGRYVNRAWQLAIERQFEKLLPYRLYGNAKDNGIEFVLPEWDASWLRAIHGVTRTNAEELLVEAVTGSPLLALAFRRIAETSLLLSRSFKRTPLWQKRLRGEELLRSALPYADRFPFLREAMKECLYDYLDLEGLKDVLERIQDGRTELVVRETAHPSPFASQFLADYVNMRIYEGEGVDETIQMQLLNVSKELAGRLFGEDKLVGVVRPEVVEEETRRLEEPDRAPRNAEELYRLLKQRGDKTAEELAKLAGGEALVWLEELRERGRALAVDLTGDGEYRWICSDEKEIYEEFPDSADSVSFVVGRYADHVLSFTETELCERYPRLTFAHARRIVEEMLEREQIERAPHAADERERIWTSAKVASRLVRLSIREAGKQAAPADPARWCGQIARMQMVLQGMQQQGTEGLRHVIGKMQGLFAPLSHWETILFPSRLTRYRKEELDLLCASGEVIWLGRKEEGDKEGKIAFFLAESKELYAPYVSQAAEAAAKTKHPRLLERIRSGGASFLTKLAREEGKTPSELLPDLLDLVWEGLASNDQFAPLRLSQAPRSKKGADRTGSGFGRWYWTGTLADEGEAEPGERSKGAEESAVHWARHLLESFGLVNKELVARVSPYSWETFYPVMKRLEEWGAVTRGVYVAGDPTLQFTTRELAEAIKQPIKQPVQGAGDDAVTVLSAADPANPYGLLVDWPGSAKGASFSRKPGNYLVLQGERCVFWIENNGRRIYTMNAGGVGGTASSPAEGGSSRALASSDAADTLEATDAAGAPAAESPEARTVLLKSALFSLLRRQGLVKVVIDSWDGQPVSGTEEGRLLREMGAEADRKSLVFWAN